MQAKDAGADCVKFQLFDEDNLVNKKLKIYKHVKDKKLKIYKHVKDKKLKFQLNKLKNFQNIQKI